MALESRYRDTRPMPSSQSPHDGAGSPVPFPECLHAARAGDPVAQEALFSRFYPRVEKQVHLALERDMRMGRGWLHARFSTGDVVQDVFKSLLGNLEDFSGETEEAFVGYLSMIIRNRILDAIRFHEASRRDGRSSRSIPEGGVGPQDGMGPATQAASNDQVQQFQDALKSFPEQEQLLLRGRLEDELSFQELADKLGYSSSFSARRAFYSAQARLALLLGGESQE